MASLRVSLLLGAALLLVGCLTVETGTRYPAHFEMDEAGAAELARLGQRTCLVEAVTAPTAACPEEATGADHPATGVLVLESVAKTVGLARWPDADVESGDVVVNDGAGTARMSWQHASNGLVAPLIAPGFSDFYALLGHYRDDESDREIRFNGSTPENEWVGREGAVIVAYVDPGPRPAYSDRVRPTENAPDFRYVDEGGGLYRGQDLVVVLDGSLLQTLRVVTVSDARLAPDRPEGPPFVPGPGSRVDIDDYAAHAPGPIAAAYAPLGPAVASVASPSLGTCPNACQVHPVPLTGTPVAEPAASAQGQLFAPYLPEWREGSGNTAAGRYDAYAQGYTPWIDLLLLTGYRYDFNGPLLGGARGDDPTMAPGYLGFEVWTGFWKDQNGDGHVGAAPQPDPYEGGARPMPDDYIHHRNEFVHADPVGLEFDTFNVTFIPDTEWGATGVFVVWYVSGVWFVPYAFPNPECAHMPLPGDVCVANWYSGSSPIVIEALRPTWTSDTTPGHYKMAVYLFLPAGSPGFTACTDALELRRFIGDSEVADVVRDCDRVAPFTTSA
ncbi:MAG TPA: hypothetical protein VM889_12895 [Candidatus Thermoplasmatota archaeon]|nr:hypothetical protein [Candidatus Thermoplasmatota archaeon]